MSRSLVLTHADLDGMVSGILLLRGLGADTEVRITNGAKLAHEVESTASATDRPETVHIADIPLDVANADRLLQAVDCLNRQGTEFHLYDHHFGWEKEEYCFRFRPLFATYVVDPTRTTAAALVWRDFLKRDNASQRWLQLLSEKADSEDPEIRDGFLLLAAVMQPRYMRRRVDVMRSFAFGEAVPDREPITRWYLDEYIPRERSLAAQAEILETQSGRRIGWLDLRGCRNIYPSIGRLIIEMHSVDLAACVVPNGVIIGSSMIDGMDLSFLHGRHSEENVKFEGVGHKSPVRLRPLSGGVDDAFVQIARRFVARRF